MLTENTRAFRKFQAEQHAARRLTPALDLSVRRAIGALRDVLRDLDDVDGDDIFLDGVDLLDNVRDRGLEPIYGYLTEALNGPEDYDDDEDDE